MSFRGRLFLASTLAVLVPLAVLALGVRREMDRRLGDESRRRGAAAIERLGADLALERERVAARLQALGRGLTADNRFRLGLLGESASRGYLLDWAGEAMRLSGLSLLQLQDSAGRIVSSGHFRNEYDQVRRELPRFLAEVGTAPALVQVRTPEAALLALAVADSVTVAGKRLTLVGGVAAEERFLRGLDPDPDLTVTLALPASEPTAGDVVGTLALPFLDLRSRAPDSARVVVARSGATLAALRQGLNTWVLVALGVTALLALLLAAWLSRVLSRPLTDLAEKTASIDLDRLDQDFATERGDEIGALSQLLGEMTLRLRRAVAGLREAERRIAMGDLARQVNHDIKNGLVPIRNVLRHLDQVARQDPAALAGVFEERRATLESSVAYLETLARNYARLSPAASPERCDLNDLVAEVLQGSKSGPPIRSDLAEGLPPVGVDRLMLRRVIENLIGNAADAAAGRDGGTVTVSTERAAPDGQGSVVRVHVSDTGMGMTRAELDRAFDDFYTTKPGGTGLGLSIVRRLVLDLGGSLRIDTEPGTGTRATVEIPPMTLVLVVDDVAPLAEQYAYDLHRTGGYEVLVAPTGEKALEILGSAPVDCVVLDLEMPGMDGFEVLRALERKGSQVPVIVYTGTGSYDRCVQAVRLGAYGFIDKAEPMERVVHEIGSAMERGRLRAENSALRRQLGRETSLVGGSAAMAELRATIAKVAPVPSQVLIVGESGSGKELVARDLHRFGPHPSGPFVALNCAALPESLVESELFGHERGAFTGAIATRKGAFEAAERGTLFLDEVGELPLQAQAKLLRVLEERQVTRLGGTKPVKVEARIVAATNRDLEAEVRAGRFRADLYFRLAVHVIRVPPLRERLSDIPALAEQFLAGICARFGMRRKKIAPDALDLLMAYEWRRNNVRELRNVVERMIIAAGGEVIAPEHVPVEVRSAAAPAAAQPTPAGLGFQELKAEAERRIIVSALERHDWHVTRTAQALGLADHASLLKIMRRHGIRREGVQRPGNGHAEAE